MKTRAAETAKKIREELKTNFPTIKFSVTSKRYAGGSSVNVEWTDGPIYEEVDPIVNKYEDGHFNGMNDSYEYDKDNVGGVKFVFTRRNNSTDNTTNN